MDSLEIPQIVVMVRQMTDIALQSQQVGPSPTVGKGAKHPEKGKLLIEEVMAKAVMKFKKEESISSWPPMSPKGALRVLTSSGIHDGTGTRTRALALDGAPCID